MLKILKKNFSKLSLRMKIVLLIGSTAVIIPAVLIGLLASVYYYLGIEKMFNEEVSNSIERTVHIAELYMEEHINSIKIDALLTANAINNLMPNLINNEKKANKFLDERAMESGLADIMIFSSSAKSGTARTIAHTSLSYSLLFDIVPVEAIKVANSGEIYIHRGTNNKVQAVLRLDKMQSIYLLVGRYIDPEISSHLSVTASSAIDYLDLKKKMETIRTRVICAFLILSSGVIIISALIAHKLAGIIIKPINKLVETTSIIKSGNLSVRAPESMGIDEINTLSRAFNKMTARISEQHEELAYANYTIDKRVRFIEAVLSELSAGVLALDSNGMIGLYNSSALRILKIDNLSLIDKLSYDRIFPEIKEEIESLILLGKQNVEVCKYTEKSLEIKRDRNKINLLVKIEALLDVSGNIENIIVTFDDITELLAIHRLKAWHEIARRVAHEIKNPLTPIQLSIERLQKKFSSQIKSDHNSFDRYISIIKSRVEEIQVMVTEFLEFARMSPPKLQKTNICSLIEETIFLQQNANLNIIYNFISEGTLYAHCDDGQITQVITNLLKNSAEAIITKGLPGVIDIEVNDKNDYIIIKISDNGVGLDDKIIDKICEPYVTTKTGGTGLGLAIVKKIIEEHKGRFSIINNKNNGACATFSLQKV